MSKIKSIVLALLFPAVCAAASVDELAQELARTAPTPCLDFAIRLQIEPTLQQGADRLVGSVGRVHGVSPKWRIGNERFDGSSALLLNAFRSDAEIQAWLGRFDGRHLALAAFRKATAEDQAFLLQFFKTPEGKFYWVNILDGATCSGFLGEDKLGGWHLMPDQLRRVAQWRARLTTMREESAHEFEGFDAAQRANFQRGRRLVAQLMKFELSDGGYSASLAVDESAKRAMERVFQAVEPQIAMDVERFKADEN